MVGRAIRLGWRRKGRKMDRTGLAGGKQRRRKKRKGK